MPSASSEKLQKTSLLEQITDPVTKRAVAACVAIALPILAYMNFSDGMSELLLSPATVASTPLFGSLGFADNLTLADWTGRINYVGVTIFETVLSTIVITYCIFAVAATAISRRESKKPTFKQRSIIVTLTAAILLSVGAVTGIAEAWNGRAAINPSCFKEASFYDDAISAQKTSTGWNALDNVSGFIVRWSSMPFPVGLDEKDALTNEQEKVRQAKSGADAVREMVVPQIFCAVQARQDHSDGKLLNSHVAAWNVLNLNTITAYSASVICFLTIAYLSIGVGTNDLEIRGKRLKLILMGLAALMSVGVAQLKAYFAWPTKMLDEHSRQPFVDLADASANYIGTTASFTLFAAFAIPMILWQYDVARAKGFKQGTKLDLGTVFKFTDVIAFASIAAAPALTPSLVKLISGH